jgi:hypothetical protein
VREWLPAAAAAATATATRTATIAAASATAAWTTATGTGLVLRFVDAQRTAVHRKPIECLNCTRRIGLGHFHETETTRAARFPVRRECHGLNRAVLREQRAHFGFTGRERQVANVNLGHKVEISNPIQVVFDT